MHTQSIVSIGRAAALLQRMPQEIHRLADELGIEVAMRLNLTDHFREEDLEKIAAHLRQQRGELPR